MISNGHVKLTGDKITFISNHLAVSKRTVRRKIKSLLALNWIGYNPTSKYYFIRSIDTVRIIEKIAKRRAYWLKLKYINDIKGFCAATIITELIISQKRKLSRGWAEKQGRQFKPPAYYKISLYSVTKIFGLSQRNASSLRNQSTENFTEVRENFEPLIICGKQLSCNSKTFIRHYLTNQELRKLRCINKKLFIQLPNSYRSRLTSGKRRNGQNWKH